MSKDKRGVSKSIKNICTTNNYRRDLQKVAVRRACTILDSQQATPIEEGKRSEKKRS